MPEGLIDCYLHIDKYLTVFRQKGLFKMKGLQSSVWESKYLVFGPFKLSIDETPGDTVSHAGGSDLMAANM